ncbi:tyrosine-type recombinase/integrase [Streptomyces sp. NPDC002845]
MFEEKTYKRCACTGPLVHKRGKRKGQPVLNEDGTPKIGRLEKDCPKLSKRSHGSWYYSIEIPAGPGGERRRAKKGGHKTQEEAAKAAEAAWEAAKAGVDLTSKETVTEFLTRWLKASTRKPTTSHGYRSHIDHYLIPYLGHLRMRDLRLHHIRAMFTAINEDNEQRSAHLVKVALLEEDCERARTAWRSSPAPRPPELRQAWQKARDELAEARKNLKHPTKAATHHRIKATLSSALKAAVQEQLIPQNWARLVTLPSGKRPKALVWTPERVRRWERTGKKPSPVMVWTPKQTGAFLDSVVDDRLYPLWHLITFRGLRRGEACALSWDEVDLENGVIHITEQIVTVSYETHQDEPKADSVRDINLDRESLRLLRKWRKQQQEEQAEWDRYKARADSTPRVFTKENGETYHPQYFTDRFERLHKKARLPPVRLHDLRHGSATLALAAGVDKKVVQETLGHSSYHLTMDTYTSVLPELDKLAAEATLLIVPRAGRDDGESDAPGEQEDEVEKFRDFLDQISPEDFGTSDE